jgi:hypothetical protein
VPVGAIAGKAPRSDTSLVKSPHGEVETLGPNAPVRSARACPPAGAIDKLRK